MITFETLPPEIRSLIYSHLLSNAKICIYYDGRMNTSQYPYQITGVCRLLRHETLPFLRTPSPQYRIRLECEGGRFPDTIRQRIPSRILRNIGVISLYTTKRCPYLQYDEIKPTSSTFPHLETLELDLRIVKVCMVRMMTRHARRQKREFESKAMIEDGTGHQAWCVEVRRVMEEVAWELHVEQERPREGLERDYLAVHTLFEFLMKDRAKRGFRVLVSADELVFTNHLGVLPGVRFDWDDVGEDM